MTINRQMSKICYKFDALMLNPIIKFGNCDVLFFLVKCHFHIGKQACLNGKHANIIYKTQQIIQEMIHVCHRRIIVFISKKMMKNSVQK